jgi:hypothetical protein
MTPLHKELLHGLLITYLQLVGLTLT